MDLRVQKVIAFLQAHPTETFRVADLADQVNVSPWHLSHLFLTEIRMPPTVFSRRLKFEQATRLLAETFLSVKEVMAAVGIHDKSHFAKEFRRLYGMSPTEYRRRHQR